MLCLLSSAAPKHPLHACSLPPPPLPPHQAEEVTALAWNPAAPQLALGTAKGGGLIYDCSSGSALPLALGRAAKPVCCAAWSAAAAPGGLLALGCKGGLLLLCRVADGGLARSVQLKAAVSQLQFCEPEADGAGSDGGQALLAANVGKRSVCVWQLPRALAADSSSSSPRAGAAATGAGAPPFELCFREGYGELEHFCWCSPRLLAAGFSTGQLVAVSLSGGLQPGSAAGTERFSALCLQGGVAALAWCPASGTLAAGAGCQLALLSCQGQEVALLAEAESLDLEAGQRLAGLHFCGAGTHLTAACTGGRLLHLLVRPPLLHGAWGGQVAYVDAGACPTEALLVAADQPWPAAPVALPLLVEPDLLALGPGQLAAAQGSTVSGGVLAWPAARSRLVAAMLHCAF